MACRLHACTMCIFFILFFRFLFHSRYLFIHLFLFYLYYWFWRLLQSDLLGEWWATSKSLRTMSKWVDDSKKTSGKACESGWYPCDSRRKVSTVGYLEVELVTCSLPRDARLKVFLYWTKARFNMVVAVGNERVLGLLNWLWFGSRIREY